MSIIPEFTDIITNEIKQSKKETYHALSKIPHRHKLPHHLIYQRHLTHNKENTMLPLPLIISGVTTIYNIIEYINNDK